MVHGNGWQTLYGHLAGFAIHSGQRVVSGQVIGYEGTTGNSTGCHLHFGVNHNGQWVNPLAYLP
jgi:murein DD-endopeptidase MepM/ murein hydrolase activator NlpD